VGASEKWALASETRAKIGRWLRREPAKVGTSEGTTTAAAVLQLAICWDGGAAVQLSGIWLGLWVSASGGAAQSAFILNGKVQMALKDQCRWLKPEKVALFRRFTCTRLWSQEGGGPMRRAQRRHLPHPSPHRGEIPPLDAAAPCYFKSSPTAMLLAQDCIDKRDSAEKAHPRKYNYGESNQCRRAERARVAYYQFGTYLIVFAPWNLFSSVVPNSQCAVHTSSTQMEHRFLTTKVGSLFFYFYFFLFMSPLAF
jgi:hypothetical protein